nr:apolipoprotein B-100 isoform X2 [Pseudochaenichthys georgianus]
MVGTANLKNGPKVSCQVEIEVPQTCRFVMHTRDCALSEVSAMDPQGQPVYSQARGFAAFQAAMEKNPLKFTVEEIAVAQLYPETDEPVNILNIKRGIVSALMVPVIEDETKSFMNTVHGQCLTDYLVHARKDIATDVTLSRDLSQCDQFYSRELVNSPLAMLQKLHRPMSKLITSTQDCNYKFENKGKHITAAICTEKHIYLPFSHEDNVISSVVTQDIIFKSSKRINNKVFEVNPSQSKPLHFEGPEDKAPVQTKDTVLSSLQDLVTLAGTDQSRKRAGLFHKFVSSLRVLRNETLSQALTEMLDMSGWLTWQALLQCGTTECSSAMLHAIRTNDGLSPGVDALVYGLSLQPHPDATLVRDMLSMAQYKQSRAIMYALANTVKKFHKADVSPVVKDVSKFFETLLNDCSGEILDEDTLADHEDMSFLILRVVAVMGQAMQAANPSLISSILRCAKKTDIPLSNQKAAIQAFRLMDINDEVRNIFMEVYEDAQSPVEKRVAAYLMLMKSPDHALVTNILNNLENVSDKQLKSFVVSHLKNIHKSGETQMYQSRKDIELVLEDTNTLVDGMSSHYKIESVLGSIQSNIIFNATDTLPKEVMLETTLKVFDYNYDIFEVGVEGTGFEPTIDALFGEQGFFPDSISKVMYWAGDKANILREVLEKVFPEKDRTKRQVPENLLKYIANSAQKLMEDVHVSPAPETIAYLRLLGAEIGYMKTKDMRNMAQTLSMYYHVFMRELPVKAFFALTSSTENEIFAHYIFMENAFSLSTASGFPLKFSMAGVIAPGVKGGFTHSPTKTMTDLSFMPSVGLEFITQMGVHIPDYLEAGLEMHSQLYSESSLNAKVTLSRNQMRLSIPAPKSNTQLFSISNEMLSVSCGQTEKVPSLLEDRIDSTDCQPLLRGLNICTIVRYSNATSIDQASYNPLNGESRFAVEIQPTGEVSQYTATIIDETLREGKKGRHKVDSLKLTLKAEGFDSLEATASLKYNRNKNTLTTEVVIPDYDVEAGIKLAVIESDARGKKMRGITIDVTNRNIPQLTLVGHTRLHMMNDAMLQIQMVIPVLKTEAFVTATLKKDKDLLMDLVTAINLPKTSYQQKASLKCDDDKFEVELKSDMNIEIHKLIPSIVDYHMQLQQLIDHILDQTVAKTDMKLRHIVTKGIEAGDIWLDKLTARIPYLVNLRSKRSISDLTLPALPEKLFMLSDSLFRYQFNKDKMAISIPLPHGGNTSEELNIPTTVSIPLIDLPKIGLNIPAKTVHLPSFTIPPFLDLTVPLLGLVEASTKINSNFYSWEGSISGGNNTVDVPNYIVQYKAMAQSPFNLLSYKLEGTGMMSGKADDNLKYLLNSSFSHSLIDTSFSVFNTLTVTNTLNARANYKIEASSPIGLQASLYYSAKSTSTIDSCKVSGDGTFDGLLKICSFYTNTSYTHSYNMRPLEGKGRGDSNLHFNLPFMEVHNMIQGVYENSELNIVSKTNVQKDVFNHVADLKYKDAQLTLKCNAVASAMGTSLNNKVELGVSSQMAILRIESKADGDSNRAFSLITGSLDSNGLEVNSEGSLTLDTGRGLHKASVLVSRNGLTTSGTNIIQCSPVTVENIFSGAIDNNGASLSSGVKTMAMESRGELNIEVKITAAEASLNGVFKGHAYDATTRNNIDIILNRRALAFTSNTMGTFKQMNTENSHTLTLTLWTLALQSKTKNVICEDMHYKQDTRVNIKPFVMSFDLSNDLRFYDINLNNVGHMKLEPIKMDLSGNMKGAYGEENNIKHTYELSIDNMAGKMKYNMSGNLTDAQLSHNCELEIAGLSSKLNCEAQMKSEPLRFDSTIRTMAQPFRLTLDAIVNSDGEINLYGKHAGQLNSKLLIRAEPLAFTHSHDTRVSTTHMLPSGESSTHLENRFDGLLTPSDQSLTWKVKSELNNHAYNQDISTFNNPEKIGLEFSGVMLTDIFKNLGKKDTKSEIQEFSMAGFIKYDKNGDCHVIDIPLIESFPVALEQYKNTLVQALESLQQFIHNLDVIQLITDVRAKLDRVPMQVTHFMQEMDLENKVNKVKVKLDYLVNEFAVTMNDLEVAVNNLREFIENTVMDFATKVRDLILTIKEYVKARHLVNMITDVLSQIGNQLWSIDEQHEIKHSLVKALDTIEDIIRQIDVQKLTESSYVWLREFDSEYGVLEKIKDKLSEIKQAIHIFDFKMFFEDLKDYLLSIDLANYFEQLSYRIPSSEIAKVMESMNDVIVNWIDEYEIPSKINTLYFYIRDLLLKYSLDEKCKELLDQLVILVNEFKIDETVRLIVETLKSVNFEFVYDKSMQLLLSVTRQLKEIEFRKIIDELHKHISSMIKSLKEFDYSAFVDESNKKIAELTNYINKQIKTYEIVQKLEAVREFFREIQSSTFTYLDNLKKTKLADALNTLKTVIDKTFYNDIKMKVQDILEDMRQRILDMDIRHEMYIYLKRANESYTNVVAYISAKFNQLTVEIRKRANDKEIITQIKQTVDGVLVALRTAEIKVSTFTIPLTDLIIPAFTINLKELQEISIPAQISVPEFTVLNTYTIPAFTIAFDEIKANIIYIIDNIREFEIELRDPGEIFGDLKVLYLPELPDLTLPEISLSELTLSAFIIPKLNYNDFKITMLPIPVFTLPEVRSDICIPMFGKLHGEFTVNSPQYTLHTTGKIENSTSTPKNPQFTATLTSFAKSPIGPLEYTYEATAQLETPKMKKLLFTETVKATHVAFSIDHGVSMTLTGSSAEASAKTTAKATTQIYTANLVNNMKLTLKNGIFAVIDTNYDHSVDNPSIETSNQASVKQYITASLDSGRITVTGETTGNGKWSIQDYFDEGTYNSNAEFNINFSTAKFTFVGETDCKAMKLKQMLTAESVILNHVTVLAKWETEVPSVKNSVMILNAEANISDLKIAARASHNAELTGSLTGFIANSLEFMVHPFEIVLDVKNKVNSKMIFPLKLTGKVDLQQDYSVVLNSEKQHACSFTLARFNQYKYNHNFTAENNDLDIFFHSYANGEANLDFLTVPLTIPEITVPYLNVNIPEVKELSLWENAGFTTLLTNPQQSFDINLKMHYYKNPDTHIFELHLEPIYNVIIDNADFIQAQFEQCRDKVVAHLKDSYNKAKSQYIKHKIDTSSLPPQTFTVPGYKIPILNIDVSAISAEMPAFSYFVPKEVSTPSFKVPALGFTVPSYTLVLPSLGLPVIHVPETLGEIQLPTFTLPAIQNNILIPAMGNITFDFFFKSTIITLSSNAGFFNYSDIAARFSTSSTSVFDVLNGKMYGTTRLAKNRGIQLVTTVYLEHKHVEANHTCDVSLTEKSLEASLVNTAKINLPFLNLQFGQELTGNTKTNATLVSKKKIKYMLNIPLIRLVGKGNLDINWVLEAPSSYVLLETSTEGKSDITLMDSCNFDGELENVARFYLNANNLRSTVRTVVNSNIDKQEKLKRSTYNKVFQFDVNNNMALEVSLRRMFATVDHTSNNNIDIASFNTNGKYIVIGELDVVPLTTFKTTLNIDASQPSSLGNTGLFQSINLAISSDKQTFTWSGKEQLASIIHACDLLISNDESEVRLDLTGSVEGHQAFLKSVRLPVYHKTIWDVLKYDQVTHLDDLHVFNISSSIVYTKTMYGQEYKIPFKLFENSMTFNIPEISIAVPFWMKEIPLSIRKTDMRFEKPDVPDHLTLPPAISVPAFDVPFTNLHVEPFTIHPKNLTMPKVITTTAFQIMLPLLPIMSVPSYIIETEYLQGKTSFLSFKIPQYEITVSSFTLPTSFDIGEHSISLNEITNQILNFELPTIIIPEQKIEVPETAFHLPSSVFIPAFGSLSATLKVSSPIYNVSTTAQLEKKNSKLITLLNSTCTSTMIFLEYDLSASAILGLDNGVFDLNGKCNLIHSDVNFDWQHVLSKNLRMKRQTPLADSMESRHTLNVDVSSRTFFDMSFRFASRKDGITASMSCPSSGFLGWQFQRRSPSQLNGTLFSRSMSSHERDIDVFSAKATLTNSKKMILQMSWNFDFFLNVIEGTKDRIPAMTDAVLKFFNKYHTYHFGFDVNQGGMKLKTTVSNVIERAYHEMPLSFNTLHNSIKHLADQLEGMYRKASEGLHSLSVQDVVDRLSLEARQRLKYGEDHIHVLLDKVTQSLSDIKFTLPGSQEELSSLEMLQQACSSVSRATDRTLLRFASLVETIIRYIREIKCTLPGTDVVVNGKETMDNLMSSTRSVYVQLRHSVHRGFDLLHKTLDDLLQVIAEKAESLIKYLKNENVNIASQVDSIYAEVLHSSNQHAEEAHRYVAQYKEHAKMQIQKAYNALRMERVDKDAKEFISIVQSHLDRGFNESVDLMRVTSQSTAPYIRVSNTKVEFEIPLPFLWKSFSGWPTHSSQ